MGSFVNTYIQSVAGKSAPQVGNQENNPPGCVAQEPRKGNLKSNTEKDHAESPGVPADKGPDFRMFMYNFFGSWFVRLAFQAPPKAVQLGHISVIERQI